MGGCNYAARILLKIPMREDMSPEVPVRKSMDTERERKREGEMEGEKEKPEMRELGIPL